MPHTGSVFDFSHIFLLLGSGLVLTLAVFGSLAVVVSMLNYESSPVRDRLWMFKEKGVFKRDKVLQGAFDDLQETLITFSEPLAQRLYGENLKYQKQVKMLLTEAGLPDTQAQVMRFLARRAATGLVLGAVAFAVVTVMFAQMVFGLFALLAGFMIGSLIPQILLRTKADVRKTEIRYTLPDTLDLMVVCVEAGLGLDSTLQRVSEETERIAPEVSYEMKRVNKEINAGITRIEALTGMGQRSGVDELRSLCSMIVQADKMGTSIADTLRVYADDLRTRRRQRAEELASKASIKMTFPLVLFIFPPLFIILLGPIIITSLQNFSLAPK